MARKSKAEAGEQIPLIDVEPENVKAILKRARVLLNAKADAKDARECAAEAESALVTEIMAAKLKPVDGVWRVPVDGMIITVTPREHAVKIEETGNPADAKP